MIGFIGFGGTTDGIMVDKLFNKLILSSWSSSVPNRQVQPLLLPFMRFSLVASSLWPSALARHNFPA